MLPKEPDEISHVQRVLRSTSNLAKAREPIKQRGKPLHISAILEAIGISNDKKTDFL